jgi:hypothetical protein
LLVKPSPHALVKPQGNIPCRAVDQHGLCSGHLRAWRGTLQELSAAAFLKWYEVPAMSDAGSLGGFVSLCFVSTRPVAIQKGMRLFSINAPQGSQLLDRPPRFGCRRLWFSSTDSPPSRKTESTVHTCFVHTYLLAYMLCRAKSYMDTCGEPRQRDRDGFFFVTAIKQVL